MKAFLFLAAMLLTVSVSAQEKEMMFLCGVTTMDEIPESELERFHRLVTFPVVINQAGRNRLNTCGLFTAYQAAAIKDYIMNHGDILSASELALVDGFGQEMAEAVKPFVSFAPIHAVGSKEDNDTLTARQEVMAKASFKRVIQEQDSHSYAGKYNIETNKGISAALAYKEALSGNISYEGRRHLSKLIIGDFYARFGQGLAMWDGFSMSMNTVGSLTRRQSGFVPAHTFSVSTARRGVAVSSDLSLKGGSMLETSAFISGFSMDGVESFGGNITAYGRSGQTGVSLIRDSGILTVSVDNRTHLRKTDIFSEVAGDLMAGGIKAAAGLTFTPEYGHTYGVMARHAEKEELYLGMKRNATEAFFSAELNRKKGTQTFKATYIREGKALSDRLGIRIKANQRFKPDDKHRFRSSITAESTLGDDEEFLKLRADLVYSSGFSQLGYLETGKRNMAGVVNVFLRAGLFNIQNWDNRIYVYERDAPGSFNIPAYYGRGWNASLYSSLKYHSTKYWKSTLYLRASYVGYLKTEQKPDKIELRIQWNLSM